MQLAALEQITIIRILAFVHVTQALHPAVVQAAVPPVVFAVMVLVMQVKMHPPVLRTVTVKILPEILTMTVYAIT